MPPSASQNEVLPPPTLSRTFPRYARLSVALPVVPSAKFAVSVHTAPVAFFLLWSFAHPYLHSFPTRRSSDLPFPPFSSALSSPSVAPSAQCAVAVSVSHTPPPRSSSRVKIGSAHV